MPLQQEAGGSRSGVILGPWAWRRGCPSGRKQGRQERIPAVTYYSAREEGIGGAGTFGEESLRTCLYRVTGVPSININRQIPAVAKLQLPSCLDRSG